MLELPEARVAAKDLQTTILGKTVVDIRGDFTSHKFTFYYEDPEQYKNFITGKQITKINERNFYVEIEIEDYVLLFRDGANIRYYDNLQDFPEKSNFLMEFQDGSFINVTTSMYAFIGVFNKKVGCNNSYYQTELSGIGALDNEFSLAYFKKLAASFPKLSIKAFLAAEQRILGIGNGILQDILFNAEINPKRKINTLDDYALERLYNAIQSTIKKMLELDGRDTEKNIYGNTGKYKTILSSKTYKNGCPKCHGEIKKEAYLGGSVYYCPTCQK